MPRTLVRCTALALVLAGTSLATSVAPSAAQSSTSTCTTTYDCNTFKGWCLDAGAKAGVKASVVEVEVDGTTLQRCHLHR